jgi:hypothetical protein
MYWNVLDSSGIQTYWASAMSWLNPKKSRCRKSCNAQYAIRKTLHPKFKRQSRPATCAPSLCEITLIFQAARCRTTGLRGEWWRCVTVGHAQPNGTFLRPFCGSRLSQPPRVNIYIDLAYIFSECMKSVNSTGAQLDLDSMDSMNRIAYHWLQHVSNMCISAY